MRDQKALDALLVRWHRWSGDPLTSNDTTMKELDRLVGALRPCFAAALIVEARNLSCGLAVWRSVRAGGRENQMRARRALLEVLAHDQHRWFGSKVVQFSERGNRVGESNPAAQASDQTVELCVQLREQVDANGKPRYSLGELAMRFKAPKSTVQRWCDGSRRGQAGVKVKAVP